MLVNTCIAFEINDLAPYTAFRMAWKAVRNHFVYLFEQSKLTQDQVAERGHVGQGRISRLVADPDYKPSAPVLLGAIRGLGLTYSDFFLQIDHPTSADIHKRPGSSIVSAPVQSSREAVVNGDSPIPVSDEQRLQILFEELSVTFGELAGRINTPRRKTSTARPRKAARAASARTNRR